MNLSDLAGSARNLCAMDPLNGLAQIQTNIEISLPSLGLRALDIIIERAGLGREDAATVDDVVEALSSYIRKSAPNASIDGAKDLSLRVMDRLRNVSSNGGGQPFSYSVPAETLGRSDTFTFQYVNLVAVKQNGKDVAVLIPTKVAQRVLLASLDPGEVNTVDLAAKAAKRAVQNGRLEAALKTIKSFHLLMNTQSDDLRELSHRIRTAPETVTPDEIRSLKDGVEKVGAWYAQADNLRSFLLDTSHTLIANAADSDRVRTEVLNIRDAVDEAHLYAGQLSAIIERTLSEAPAFMGAQYAQPTYGNGISMSLDIIPHILEMSAHDFQIASDGAAGLFAPTAVPLIHDLSSGLSDLLVEYFKVLDTGAETDLDDDE